MSKKDLQYALVTSSALPHEIQESEHYIDIEKEQWLDLVDYSTDLVNKDEDQEILFLIVAKGTAEQQAEDDARRKTKEASADKLQSDHDTHLDTIDRLKAEISILEKELDERVDIQAQNDLLKQQMNEVLGTKEQLRDKISTLEEADRLEAEREKQSEEAQTRKEKALRDKSISLFNALYQK